MPKLEDGGPDDMENKKKTRKYLMKAMKGQSKTMSPQLKDPNLYK